MFRTIHSSETVLGFSFKIEYTTPLLELREIEITAKNKTEAYRKFVPLAFDFLRGNLDLLLYAANKIRSNYLQNKKCFWTESYWNLVRLKEALTKQGDILKYCQLVQRHNFQFIIPNDHAENKTVFAETVLNIETVLPQIIQTIKKLNDENSISIFRHYKQQRPTNNRTFRGMRWKQSTSPISTRCRRRVLRTNGGTKQTQTNS
jgi:hypothetical protein